MSSSLRCNETLLRIINIAILFFLFHNIPAQQYHFHHYTATDGLASSNINHIFQDSKGYLWFATQGGGASRFNGKTFTNYTKANGLINNDVTCIAEDKQGNIWFGTAQGASKFNGQSFTNFNQTNGLTGSVVYCIYADAQNKIWFGTETDGIKICSSDTFTSLPLQNPSTEHYSITPGKNGTLWIGTGKGILHYAQGKITDYTNHPLIKNKSFFSSLTDADGHCWFGSTAGDVIKISTNDSLEKFPLPALCQHDFIGSIAQDQNGCIYFATDHGMLAYNSTFRLFSERQGLSVNTVQAVMADYENNIWAGTLGGGADLLSNQGFLHYTETDGLLSANVTALYPNPTDSTYYIGTGKGLYIYTEHKQQKLSPVKGIPAIEELNIASLSIDPQGLIWIAAQEGIFVLEKNKSTFHLRKKYNQLNGEKIISPQKVLHDAKGNTWIATYGSGIFYLQGNQVKNYNTKTHFASDKILTVFEDHQSKIWFGTQDAGVVKYNGEHFTQLLHKNGKSETAIWSITQDAQHNLYFGSGESGLYRFDGNKTTHYTTKDGLSSDYIPILQFAPGDNTLWLGSEKGLDQISFTPDYKIAQVHTYNEQDGFEPTGINQQGIFCNPQGEIWLGTVNGLWRFNPKNNLKQNISPKIQLTELRLLNQKTDWKKITDSVDAFNKVPKNLCLTHNQNQLTFYIQALTTAPVLYTYILQGQDEQWSAPSPNNEITYTNIAPGTYTFKAKAVIAEGKPGKEEITYSFTIQPPWWSTWWFRLVSLLSFLFALYAIVKAREKTLTDRNKKLEETVQQRTLEISHQKELVEKTLTEKEGLLHEKEILLKEIHHRVKNNLQTISSMLMLQSAGLKDEEAKKAITESQSRVRSIALVHQKLYQTDGLEKVELNAFVHDLTAQIQSLYRQQSQHVNIQIQIPETQLLIDKAIPLGLILNELITNSFKYAFNKTNGGEIHIAVALSDSNPTAKSKKAVLKYSDSGPGLASEHQLDNASTLGLRLIKLLSQQVGATLQYSNTNRSEFIFTFSINL